MRGVVWNAPFAIEVVQDLAPPELQSPRDAVVRVMRAGICGTDLHAYRGHIPDFRPGTVLGHEVVGVVEAVGAEVAGVRPGDRVVVSDLVACGKCRACAQGLHYQCAHVSLFGFGEVVGEYHPGGQAERMSVPDADLLLLPIPPGVTDDLAVFAADILTTGYACAVRGGVREGDVVAVVGCGPVGLCAGLAARHSGAVKLLAIDPEPARLWAAETLGFIPVVSGPGMEGRVRAEAGGAGVDVALECVGDAEALNTALAVVRGGGTVSVVGSHHETAMPFSPRDAFARELTLAFSVGDPIRDGRTVLSLLASGALDPSPILSHRIPLDNAADAYRLFDRREATKILLVP